MGGEFTIAPYANFDITKIRYYHDQEYYEPHTDRTYHFLGFSYFYKEPKKFKGGRIIISLTMNLSIHVKIIQ